jgi:hypothetical protein
MEMRAGRPAGRAHQGDFLPLRHGIAGPDDDAGQVAVTRPGSVGMPDLDQIAIAAAPSGKSTCPDAAARIGAP